MSRGYITIATGNEKYYKLAFALLKSYRNNSKKQLPFAIICDRENEYTKQFDTQIIMDSPMYSYMDKLLLFQYSPYDETIFIDADSLILNSIDEIWSDFENGDDVSCYGVKLPLNSEKAWFTYEGCGKYKEHIRYLIDLHGGIYYFRKTERTKEIFEKAIELSNHYEEYEFKNFSKPADEPVLAMSMAINECYPCEKKPRIIFVPSYRNRLSTNYAGELLLDKRKIYVEICHFATVNTKLFLYNWLEFSTSNTKKLEDYEKIVQYLRFKVACLPYAFKLNIKHILGKTARKFLSEQKIERLKGIK